MHPAYSVILFTTASGAGYGLLALLGLTGASHGAASSFAFGATSMLLALGLITVGLLSSTFHLGHPERAWRAFSQWRTSWLSREGVAAVITYIPACLFGLLWVFGGNDTLIAILGYLTAIMAMVTVFTTAMIYASLPTIRQWQHWAVVPGYVVLAIATGAVLLYALATLFGRSGIPALGVITMAGLGLAIIVKLAYWAGLSRMKPKYTMGDATGLGGTVRQWEVPHTSENFVQREMGFKVARKHAHKLRGICLGLLALALVMVWAGFSFGGAAAPVFALAAVVLSGIAVVMERWLFFAEAKHVVTLFYGEQAV
ncbi:MAG: DmsC/YnfH family molybdoenzyme membrane anchor subunit [Anderseniella sp.]|jgi:DMSO reductase anchor subunit|nr:DmsC/YnfH family molybdoenzyme membrane anchor subunit [Anderseniella sp.]